MLNWACAKGLENKILERQHIFATRPALHHHQFCNQPDRLLAVDRGTGSGLSMARRGPELYIETLPNYWGEAMEVGDLMIVITARGHLRISTGNPASFFSTSSM